MLLSELRIYQWLLTTYWIKPKFLNLEFKLLHYLTTQSSLRSLATSSLSHFYNQYLYFPYHNMQC